MLLTWTPQAWEDYLYWQHADKRTVRRINELLRDAMRNPFEGIGKPEPLRFDLAGCWSRRINQEDRLVYKLADRSEALIVLQCRYHYLKPYRSSRKLKLPARSSLPSLFGCQITWSVSIET